MSNSKELSQPLANQPGARANEEKKGLKVGKKDKKKKREISESTKRGKKIKELKHDKRSKSLSHMNTTARRTYYHPSQVHIDSISATPDI